MIEKFINKKIYLLLLILIVILPSIHAESVAQFCGGANGLINPNNTIFTFAPNAPNALLKIAILIISIMITIIGFLYAIAYAFGIEKLLIFTRNEIGEIILTGIVIVIFLMVFNLFSSSSSGISSITHVYVYDCKVMISASLGLMAPLFQLSVSNIILQTISNVQISVEPIFMGFSIAPFAGFRIISNPLNIAISISGLMLMLMLGMSVVLGIIYSFFPIFLYLGIIFRALPWTRAAGGAFLGLFAGLFVMFPLMLFFGLMGSNAILCSTSAAASTTPISSQASSTSIATAHNSSCYSSSGAVNKINNEFTKSPSSISGFLSAISNIITIGSGGILKPPFEFLVKEIIEPVLYTLIIYIFSLLIAFDFMEEIGDLLGAPALSSENVLRKVI